ncbi:hypothetical protein VDG1235_3039 [Verrucomicrobiia bacterium DG1235]|nr:hypothetical protein VDG1235_3039 [Verrucomicrobiae bacterium DG1235]
MLDHGYAGHVFAVERSEGLGPGVQLVFPPAKQFGPEGGIAGDFNRIVVGFEFIAGGPIHFFDAFGEVNLVDLFEVLRREFSEFDLDHEWNWGEEKWVGKRLQED